LEPALLPIHQLKPPSGGKCLRRLGKLADQALQDRPGGVEIVLVSEVPGGNQAAPFGAAGLRLVGHFQQQGDLLDPLVRPVQVLGE
jgi:hypothetical protein